VDAAIAAVPALAADSAAAVDTLAVDSAVAVAMAAAAATRWRWWPALIPTTEPANPAHDSKKPVCFADGFLCLCAAQNC